MTKLNKFFFIAATISVLSFTATPAISGESFSSNDGQVLYANDANATALIADKNALISEPLTLRQNMIEIITLNSDIGTIMVSDPAPVELIVENSRRVVLRPAQPGVTNITIIDKAGQVVYKREVVVTQRGENYVRLTRYCSENGCVNEDIYFCPDGCYEVKSLRDNTSGFAPVSSLGPTSEDSYQPVPGAYPTPQVTSQEGEE